MLHVIKSVSCATLLSRDLPKEFKLSDKALLVERTVGEDFSASQTAGANAMRRDTRDFYNLKRQRVRRQRNEPDDKPTNKMKISHMAQQPSADAFQRRNLLYSIRWHIR